MPPKKLLRLQRWRTRPRTSHVGIVAGEVDFIRQHETSFVQNATIMEEDNDSSYKPILEEEELVKPKKVPKKRRKPRKPRRKSSPPKIDEEAKQLNEYFDEVGDFELIVEQVQEDRYVMGTSANKSDPQPLVSMTANKNSTNNSSSWSLDKTNSRREDFVAPDENLSKRSLLPKSRKTSTKSGSSLVFSNNNRLTEFNAPENDENQPGPSTARKSDSFAESKVSISLSLTPYSFVNRSRYSLHEATAGPSGTSLQSPHFSTPRNISEASEKISKTSSLKSNASMQMFSPDKKSMSKKSKLSFDREEFVASSKISKTSSLKSNGSTPMFSPNEKSMSKKSKLSINLEKFMTSTPIKDSLQKSRLTDSVLTTAIYAENSPHLSPQPVACEIRPNCGRAISTSTIAPGGRNISQVMVENPFEVFYYLRGFTRTRTTLNYLLHVCKQDNVMPWNMFPFDSRGCKKLGEGAYGEVFQSKIDELNVALKVVPFQDEECYHDGLVNGERMKQTMEILPEVLITKELSELERTDDTTRYSTPTFVRLIQATVIRGDYPSLLLSEWDKFNKAKRSENQRPDTYSSPNQLFMVFALSLGGKDLEAYKIQNEKQAFSIFFQIALSLAIAEETLEFEHRDLHIGNVLIAQCPASETVSFTFNGSAMKIKSCGVIASIIDFTNSRMQKEGTIIFLDLSEDEELFKGTGDYQFDIYRLMREKNRDHWKDFTPHTNILWLHYLATKMFNSKKIPKKRRDEIIDQLNVLLTFDRIKSFLENSAVIQIFERYIVE
ncbi:haspin like kinase domain-containing protein [Ditylenchus destructor]|nr:haspin like kinase domain-containing protein [Ditylenchus destructor]